MPGTPQKYPVREIPPPMEGVTYHYLVRDSSVTLNLDPGNDQTKGHYLVPHTLSLVAKGNRTDACHEVVVGKLDYYSLANRGLSSDEYFEVLDRHDTSDFLDVLCDDGGHVSPFPARIVDLLGDVNYTGPVTLLRSLIIEAPWRGRGLGVALLAHALNYRMAGHSHAILNVTPLQSRRFQPKDALESAAWLRYWGFDGFTCTQCEATEKLEDVFVKLGFKYLDAPGNDCWMALSFSHDHDKAWMRALKKVK